MGTYYESTAQAKHWETEMRFIDFLEESSKVAGGFKNGEYDGNSFSIPDNDSSKEEHAFYVDFILKKKDGSCRDGFLSTGSRFFVLKTTWYKICV